MEDEIRLGASALADAIARGDALEAAGLYADEGRLLAAAAGPIAGRSQIEAYWRAGIALGLSRVELRPSELTVAEPVALEIGRYELTFDRDGGDALADRGTYLVLHRRQADGSWRRAVDVFNADVQQPARPECKEER